MLVVRPRQLLPKKDRRALPLRLLLQLQGRRRMGAKGMQALPPRRSSSKHLPRLPNRALLHELRSRLMSPA